MSPDLLAQLLPRLLARTGRGQKLGLDRIRQALTLLGDPQETLRVVHIAGTNGKGSVCAMVEAIARTAGLKTGMYSSPHLCRINERIRINGAAIDDRAFAQALTRALDEKLGTLTFFETMTATAFIAMQQAEVDLAIVEVGLGGRLDATNVIQQPRCTAITHIGFDHTHYLGEKLSMIAREKAGIAKPGAPLVIGPMPPDALQAITTHALSVGSGPIWQVMEESARQTPTNGESKQLWVRREPTANTATMIGPDRHLRVQPALAGAHQTLNAGVATAIAWELSDFELAPHIIEGLGRVDWPGRLERITLNGRKVLLDCAHNVEASLSLVNALANHNPQRTTLLFGAMSDKPWEAMLDTLAPHADRRIYCQPSEKIADRAPVAPERLAQHQPGQAFSSPVDALQRALSQSDHGDLIIVSGSIFLVGAVRAQLLSMKTDSAIPL